MSQMTGAELLIETLHREGVEVIFGIPGVQVMELLDACHRNSKVEWITVRHEQTAAYMAFGYSRTTGKTGVAMVVPGPGLLNAGAAIGTAYAASTPLLLLAGQINRPNLGKNQGVLHEVTEQLDLFRPITKWVKRVMEVSDIPDSLQEAMCQTTTGRPRPAVVEIPYDLWAEKTDVEIKPREAAGEESLNRSQIKEAAALLSKAERPVIWSGGGVITAGASEELSLLAERVKAPVLMTPEGKGALSAKHPLAALNVYYRANTILQKADLIICLGSRFFPRFRVKENGPGAPRFIQIDIDPEEVGRNWKPDLGIVADVRPALAALLEELPERGSSRWQTAEIEEYNAAIMAKLEEAIPVQTAILRDIREELDDDSIVIPGVTNLGYWANEIYPVYKPRTYLTSSYFVTLGYVFPTALGAKLGNPDKQVVALSGDGGFLFTSSDLATAVQYGVNVVTIIFNDNVYGATYRIQQNNYEGRYIGTELVNPDFAAYAESFGARGIKLPDHKDLRSALRSALLEKGPVVIEVPTPNMTTPWEVL